MVYTYTDRRITQADTADAIAEITKRRLFMIIRGCCDAKAIYILGKRIYSKGWH